LVGTLRGFDSRGLHPSWARAPLRGAAHAAPLSLSCSGRADQAGMHRSRPDPGALKIFCFDLTLLQLWAERADGDPDVLIHDSMLFDGVDERQVAAALERAAAESERLGFQYICTLNSDALPRAELQDDSPVLTHVAIELHDPRRERHALGDRVLASDRLLPD